MSTADELAGKWDRKAFADELQQMRDAMQMGKFVAEELRRGQLQAKEDRRDG